VTIGSTAIVKALHGYSLYRFNVSSLSKSIDEIKSFNTASKVKTKPLTMREVAKKHGVSFTDILDQLVKGINVELEHTNNERAYP